MDLHVGTDRPTDAERAAVDAVVAPVGPAVDVVGERFTRGGPHRAAERRHLLLPALHALQEAAGWISPGGLNHVAETLGVPPAESYGVATFYDLFSVEPQPPVVVRVCDDIACRLFGTAAVDAALAADGLGDAARHHSPCLGVCDHGGGALVQRVGGRPVGVRVTAGAAPPVVVAGPLLSRAVRVRPTTIEAYFASGGYLALSRAFELGADAVIEAVSASGLRGRGGAAFPTGAKWRAVADQPDGVPRHVVANADESEPGTFKDRTLMEDDPFALVEALTIAGFAVGAAKGWIYVRGEYPRAIAHLEAALAGARAAGLLGPDVAGSRWSFDIEVRAGAGAYVCGEETALLNSIEGYRGEPRNKPPFPVTHGLFGAPTAVNNVETLVNVLPIVVDGADAYRAVGTAESSGTRLFCLSGHVARPGLYEVPFGVTLRDLVARAGGVAGGRPLQAVLLGGAAGTFLRADQLDVELSFEGARAAGVSLGSGVVMLFDDTVDLGDTLARTARFFRDESCGQCVPCRVGTQRVVEWLDAPGAGDDLLDDLDAVLRDASICGLGQAATSALRSAQRAGLPIRRGSRS